MSQELYSSATKDNPDMRGIKVRLEPSLHHPDHRPDMTDMGG